MTPDDVLALIDGHVAAAAVGAALEQGVFWLLAEEPQDAAGLADTLGIPVDQCRFWMEHLANLGLLDRRPAGYATSAGARDAIVDSYSQETWSYLAGSAREELPTISKLAAALVNPPMPAATTVATQPDYVAAMRDDPQRAQQFTRMLYEIHLPLADTVAAATPVKGAMHLLDVGGGSGVMSMALLRAAPRLTAVVFDIPSVCAVGRQIAAENGFQDRIEYRAGDFIEEDLPTDFDMVLFCDVGGYTETLLRRFRSSLRPGGRLVIVDKFGAAAGLPHHSRSHWALVGSVRSNAALRISAADVENMLRTTGFDLVSRVELPERVSRWSSGWTEIVAKS
jgi:ubiquinone/menaquinone biosynthesis C-methylase UbiE